MEFAPYSYAYSPAARQLREQFPKELLPKLLSIIDDLAVNPDGFESRSTKIGQGQFGELILYRHPNPPLEIIYEIDRQNHKMYFVHFAAPVVQLKQVFVSYSHQDVEWLKLIRKFLDPLEKRGLLNIWADTEIQVGAQWMDVIRKALESANVALFLVTQDFLTSAFIANEELAKLLAKAEQQGLLVIWIAVKGSTVNDTSLAKFQAVNDPKHPLDTLAEPQQNQVLVEIYEKIKKVALAN
jgi:hypothetical protein